MFNYQQNFGQQQQPQIPFPQQQQGGIPQLNQFNSTQGQYGQQGQFGGQDLQQGQYGQQGQFGGQRPYSSGRSNRGNSYADYYGGGGRKNNGDYGLKEMYERLSRPGFGGGLGGGGMSATPRPTAEPYEFLDLTSYPGTTGSGNDSTSDTVSGGARPPGAKYMDPQKLYDMYRRAFQNFQSPNPHQGPALSFEDWTNSSNNPNWEGPGKQLYRTLR